MSKDNAAGFSPTIIGMAIWTTIGPTDQRRKNPMFYKCVFALLASVCLAPVVVIAADKPNIIVIFADEHWKEYWKRLHDKHAVPSSS